MSRTNDYFTMLEQVGNASSASTCPACNGEGHYYEDVAGDGGSQMLIECECNWREEFDADNAVVGEDHNVWGNEEGDVDNEVENMIQEWETDTE